MVGEQIGIAPEFLFASGKNEILGPHLLLPRCRVTTTFQYQSVSNYQTTILNAELINTRDDDKVIARTSVLLPTISEERQTSCFTLDCGNRTGVVAAVRLIAKVTHQDTLEVFNIEFHHNRRCQGLIDLFTVFPGVTPCPNDPNHGYYLSRTTNRVGLLFCQTDPNHGLLFKQDY